MPKICEAIKHAHTEGEALKHLATGSSKKGYKLKRSGVAIELINIKEIKGGWHVVYNAQISQFIGASGLTG